MVLATYNLLGIWSNRNSEIARVGGTGGGWRCGCGAWPGSHPFSYSLGHSQQSLALHMVVAGLWIHNCAFFLYHEGSRERGLKSSGEDPTSLTSYPFFSGRR